jgi:pilus biogenesis lipoprotein CpaD
MKHHSIRAYTLAASAVVLLALGACAQSANWSEVQAPKRNQVEPVRLVHDVRFINGTQLSSVEMAQLDGFLARHDVGYGDRVYVLTEGAGATSQRGNVVLNYMKAHGIAAAVLPSPEAQPGLVRIVLNRYVVVPPNCPDWSKPTTPDYANMPMSNLGCANTANFGVMVADPAELIQGRQPGPADAEGSTGAIQRYRTDKVKPLEKLITGGK